jgi:hypothetical protein
MDDIKAKLALLKEKLVKNPGELSVDEKKQYLDILRVVVQEAGAMEKDLNRSVGKIGDSDHERMVLKMRGHFTRNSSGEFLLPAVEELQAELVRIGRENPSLGAMTNFTVLEIFNEKNFNYIRRSARDPNHLLQEEEVFVKFGSCEQALYILGLIHGLHFQVRGGGNGGKIPGSHYLFSLPSYDTATRAIYRVVGGLLIRLKEVDKELRQLGAVPYMGLPMLPVHFVQTEEFDEQVRLLQEEENNNNKLAPISSGRQIMGAKDSLHAYLTSKHKVDRRKRQAALDVLVDERIDILLKLCRYDPEETPFSFDREFK